MTSRDDASAVIVALRRIVRSLRLADREVEASCGISVAQLFVLHHLADEPSLSISQLAALTLTDASSVSTVVARLVERGLVGRPSSPKDRRPAQFQGTPRGPPLGPTGPRVPQLALVDALRALPAKRRSELVRNLELVAAILGANAIEPRMFFEDEPRLVTPARRRDRGVAARRAASTGESAPSRGSGARPLGGSHRARPPR